MEPGQFEGVVGRTLEESEAWWPPIPGPPPGSPNIVIVLLDDVGYAQFGCYGSDIATPTFDRLAANGLRYSNFHTTALCSPTRACLLTGRNHHASGMARIVEFSSGFPGYDATMPRANGFLSEVLVEHGYATFAVGKWHLAPAPEMAMGAPRARWPLGRGFERFYGFLAGETDQYHPDLVHDNHQVDPPRSPKRATTSPRTRRVAATSPRTSPIGRSSTSTTCGRCRPTGRSSCTSHLARATPRTGAAALPRSLSRPIRPRLGRLARGGVRPPAGIRPAAARHPPQ